MWTLFRLAVRNVRRNRSRTVLTLGAIAFGVFMTLFLGGFVQGFVDMLIDDTTLGKTGSLQVHRTGYFEVHDNQPLDFDFAASPELERTLHSVPGVVGVTPRLVFSGLLNNGSSSTLFVATAIDPRTAYDVLPFLKDDLVGAPLTEGATRGGILGLELANALEVGVGGTVVLQAAAKDGRQNALDLDVVGQLNNGNAHESKRVAFVPLAFAQELLGMQGRVTEYVISIDDRRHAEEVAARVRAALGPEFEVQTWREIKPNIADVVRFVRTVLSVICFVFLVISVIGVINTMLMSVLERTREIGTMLALGVRRAQVLGLFVFEAVVLAALGGGAGTLLGGGLIGWIGASGGVVAKAPGTTVLKKIIPSIPPELVALALGATLAGVLVAAVYPAWRASRLRPVEALRAL